MLETPEVTRVRAVSVHEGAHAAVAVALGIEVEAATIRGDAKFMGSVRTAFPEGTDPALWTMPELERRAIIALSGIVAEGELLNLEDAEASTSDLTRAYEIAFWMIGADPDSPESRMPFIEKLAEEALGESWRAAARIVGAVESGIWRIAEALEAAEEVDGEQVKAIMEREVER